MADVELHVKPKSKWKKVEINKGLGTGHDFSGLICMEELTDYEIITQTQPREETKANKEHAVTEKAKTDSSRQQVKKKKKSKQDQTWTKREQSGPIEYTDKKKKKGVIESTDKKEKKGMIDSTDKKKKKGMIESTDKKKKKGVIESTDKKKKKGMIDSTDKKKKKGMIESTDKKKKKGVIESTDKKEKEKEGMIESTDKKKKKKKRKHDVIKLSQKDVVEVREDNTEAKERKRKKSNNVNQEEGPSPKKKKKKYAKQVTQMNEDENVKETTLVKDMGSWKGMYVPVPVLRALQEDGFSVPTPIQSLALPHAIRDRLDIVGAAETGSGKTLAFGIPVIDKILLTREEKAQTLTEDNGGADDENDDGTSDMVNEDMDEVLQSDSASESGEGVADEMILDTSDVEEEAGKDVEDESSGEELGSEEEEFVEDGGIGCVNVIDDADFSSLDPALLQQFGVAPKVPRTPQRPPVALILEPTRELAVQVKNHLLKAMRYTDIKVATVVGGLSQEKQERVLKKCPEVIVATPGRLWELVQQGQTYLSFLSEIRCLVVDEADRMIEKGHFQELTHILSHVNRDAENKKKRQTFVFSATLTTVHSGPHRPVAKKIPITEELKLAQLIKKIGLKDRPKVIDLTRKVGTVDTLTEARINCTMDEKDLYLFYFLAQYPGRTLLFANSKDCIRRLVSVFTLLKFNPMPLHADMHQKQRLKNLEKFTANPRGLLLASDVAARGLDIPNVQHVVHYQVPHTVENYIHRSGRTARATKEGLSVMLVGQEDVRNYRKIISSLNRSEDMPVFPVNHQILAVIKERVSLARTLDKMEHSVTKQKRQNEWFEKAAREVDIDLDENLLNDLGDSHEKSQRKQEIQYLRAELNTLLRSSVIPKNFSGKYPTRTGRLVLPNSEVKTDAIERVKKDKKSQQRMMDKIRLASLRAKPQMEKKKKKWKKKWKK